MFGRLMLLGLCGAVAFSQSGASIEGRVLTTSGSPVRRATVSVRMPSATGTTVQVSGPNVITNLQINAVETDGEGRFSISGLSAGSAVVAASRAGYSEGTQPVVLTAGQRMTDVTIRMSRLGVIYGKVVDEYGDPFMRINVSLFRKTYENGWKWQQQSSAITGPDGTYALGDLQAGRYYIAAMNTANFNSYTGLPETSHYIQTYYPSATEPSGATPIDIAPEAELRGIDVRMQKGRMFRVSGKITSGETLQGASVNLMPRDTTVPIMFRPGGAVNMKENAFTIERVPEGTYYAVVQAQVRRPDANGANQTVTTLSGRELITVTSRDIDNLVIALTPGLTISGRYGIDGATVTGPAQPRIMLRALETSLGGQTTQTSPDGMFTIRNVIPGTYQLTASGVPNAYLASIRYDGQDVMWTPITIGGSSAGVIEALFKTDGAKVNGVVRDEKGEPLADTRVSIWAAGGKTGYVTTTTTDRTGTYRFQNVPPGEYRVVAWDKKATAAPLYAGVIVAPEFLHLFDTTAATVRLGSSSEQTQDVIFVPQAAMDAGLARLP